MNPAASSTAAAPTKPMAWPLLVAKANNDFKAPHVTAQLKALCEAYTADKDSYSWAAKVVAIQTGLQAKEAITVEESAELWKFLSQPGKTDKPTPIAKGRVKWDPNLGTPEPRSLDVSMNSPAPIAGATSLKEKMSALSRASDEKPKEKPKFVDTGAKATPAAKPAQPEAGSEKPAEASASPATAAAPGRVALLRQQAKEKADNDKQVKTSTTKVELNTDSATKESRKATADKLNTSLNAKPVEKKPKAEKRDKTVPSAAMKAMMDKLAAQKTADAANAGPEQTEASQPSEEQPVASSESSTSVPVPEAPVFTVPDAPSDGQLGVSDEPVNAPGAHYKKRPTRAATGQQGSASHSLQHPDRSALLLSARRAPSKRRFAGATVEGDDQRSSAAGKSSSRARASSSVDQSQAPERTVNVSSRSDCKIICATIAIALLVLSYLKMTSGQR